MTQTTQQFIKDIATQVNTNAERRVQRTSRKPSVSKLRAQWDRGM